MKAKFYLHHARRYMPQPLIRLQDRMRLRDQFVSKTAHWPVKWAKPTMPSPPFFIIGNPRSGSTLLRAILSQHPDVFIPPFNGQLGMMISSFGTHRKSPWEVVVEAVLEKFRRGYEFSHWHIDLEAVQRAAEAMPVTERTLANLIDLLYRTYGTLHAPGKTYWGDKSAGNSFSLEKIDLVFPEARYVHIVRNGRDCIASIVKTEFFNGSYTQAAYAWKEHVRACRRFGRRIHRQSRFFQLRYEDLVSEPEKEIEALCKFLALEPTEAMWEHHKRVAGNVADVLAIPHHKNVMQPIFRDSIGNWKEQLPQTELPTILSIMEKELAFFGYV